MENALLREAFEQSGLTASEVARRLGYFRTKRDLRKSGKVYAYRAADTSPVQAALGLKLVVESRNYPRRRRQYMREATALRYCVALGLDPVDIGL